MAQHRADMADHIAQHFQDFIPQAPAPQQVLTPPQAHGSELVAERKLSGERQESDKPDAPKPILTFDDMPSVVTTSRRIIEGRTMASRRRATFEERDQMYYSYLSKNGVNDPEKYAREFFSRKISKQDASQFHHDYLQKQNAKGTALIFSRAVQAPSSLWNGVSNLWKCCRRKN